MLCKHNRGMRLVEIRAATDDKHKYTAIFDDDGRSITTHFGAAGYSDYLHHKSKERRRLYLDRHKHREDWTDPTKAGTLSAFLLWGPTTSFTKNLKMYRSHFGV